MAAKHIQGLTLIRLKRIDEATPILNELKSNPQVPDMIDVGIAQTFRDIGQKMTLRFCCRNMFRGTPKILPHQTCCKTKILLQVQRHKPRHIKRRVLKRTCSKMLVRRKSLGIGI